MPPSLSKQVMLDDLTRFISPALLIGTAAEVDPALPVPAPWVALLLDQEQGRKLALNAYWNGFSAALPGIQNFLNTLARPVAILAEQHQDVSLLYPFTAADQLHLDAWFSIFVEDADSVAGAPTV